MVLVNEDSLNIHLYVKEELTGLMRSRGTILVSTNLAYAPVDIPTVLSGYQIIPPHQATPKQRPSRLPFTIDLYIYAAAASGGAGITVSHPSLHHSDTTID